MQETIFYVATNGRDEWSGLRPEPTDDGMDGPFATLLRARDATRLLDKEQNSAQILLREGTHFLAEPLRLEPCDSGTAQNPLRIEAYRDETPILSGAQPLFNWCPSDGPLWSTSLPTALQQDRAMGHLRISDQLALPARYPKADPAAPTTGGWLIAQWPGLPWEKGALGSAIKGVHNPGDRLEWDVEIPSAGRYQVWLRYAQHMQPQSVETMDGRTTLRIDDQPAVPLSNLSDTGAWHTFRVAHAASMDLPVGKHTLIWENVTGGEIYLDTWALSDDKQWDPSKSIRPQTWWGKLDITPPGEGHHLLLIQAESCSRYKATDIIIPRAHVPGTMNEIALAADQWPDWENWKSAEVHIFPSWGWVNAIAPITGADANTHRLAIDCEQDVRAGNRFYISNARDALTEPNEWYWDRDTEELVVWPKAAENLAQASVPHLDRLIEMSGDMQADRHVEHIHIRGLTFEDTTYTSPGGYYEPSDAAIWLSTASHCRIEDCRFIDLGGYAVMMERGSHDNAIIGNEMGHLGQGGVILRGANTDHPENNEISANHIHDCGTIYKHVGGIYITTGSGNQITYNLIERMPRYGISVKSYDERSSHNNNVAYNRLYDMNLETCDTGAIEMLGRDQALSGNTFNYNLIRNVVGLNTDTDGNFVTPYYNWGIYLDDYSSGTTIIGNVVIGTVLGGVSLHGGRDNTIENNIFVDGLKQQMWVDPIDDLQTGNVCQHNIFVFRDKEAVLWRSRPDRWNLTRLSLCDHNLYWHTGGLDLTGDLPDLTPEGNWQAWQKAGYDQHSLITDPQFIDPQADELNLSADSPAWSLGFVAIPYQEIGPQGYTRFEENEA